ncbi:MAG: sodium:calcium antiporter [Cryomorphaceae bacterium]
MLVGGGKLVVDNAVGIAQAFGVSETLIGLTIVAAGTSLPELATSAMAAIKKKADIAAGNIIGSNIFNIFFVLGLSSVIKPIAYDPALNTDIYILLGATALLFIFMFSGKKKKLDRWEAAVLLLAFIGYTIYMVASEVQ